MFTDGPDRLRDLHILVVVVFTCENLPVLYGNGVERRNLPWLHGQNDRQCQIVLRETHTPSL
jgi:hypothetical protein